jgi:hypothetical protein
MFIRYLPPTGLHVRSASPSESSALKCLRCIVIRLRFTESTSSIPLLCDDWTSALATLKAAASRSTVSVRSASARDELSSSDSSCAYPVLSSTDSSCANPSITGSCASASIGISVRSVSAIQGVVVRLSFAESASMAIFVCDEWRCAFSGYEIAAGRRALRI